MKHLKRLLPVLLVLVLCVSLLAPAAGAASYRAGRKTPTAVDIAGSWRGLIDFRALLIKQIEDEMDGSNVHLDDYLDEAIMEMYILFDGEGGYSTFVASADLQEQLIEAIVPFMHDMIAEKMGREMSDDEIAALIGGSLEDLCREEFGSLVKEMEEEAQGDGEYAVEDDTVILDDELELTLEGGMLAGELPGLGDVVFERVDLSTIYLDEDGLLIVDTGIFGLTLEELEEETSLRIAENKDPDDAPEGSATYVAYLGGVTSKLVFYNDQLCGVLYNAQEGEYDLDALLDIADTQYTSIDNDSIWFIDDGKCFLAISEIELIDGTICLCQGVYLNDPDFIRVSSDMMKEQ